MVVPAWSYWKALSYTEAPCHARRRSFSRLIDQPNEMRPVRKCAKPVTSVNLVNLFRKSLCFQSRHGPSPWPSDGAFGAAGRARL